ncbi:MAG: sulfite exporter TauE/SafE family protein [Hyphomicrobiales bacterium]|nr:sulfite exporter TauE/SafE family protein [Hyphomicrobiales bacterium]
MDPLHVLLLLAASIVAGVVNSLAGGGSLVTLPVLLGLGLPPAAANATNAVAAWSGLIGGGLRCREMLASHGRSVAVLALLSLLGGAIGGGLMLATPKAWLQAAMPWMILLATLAFVLAPLLRGREPTSAGWDLSRAEDLWGWRGPAQVLVAILTGFFNPAGGVAMVALYQAFGIEDLRVANGLKIVLGAAMTGASVVVFVLAGAVVWPIALTMIVGTVVGGWLGATLALRVDRRWLRGALIAWGGVMSAAFLLPA